jgi:hypothetical protein
VNTPHRRHRCRARQSIRHRTRSFPKYVTSILGAASIGVLRALVLLSVSSVQQHVLKATSSIIFSFCSFFTSCRLLFI